MCNSVFTLNFYQLLFVLIDWCDEIKMNEQIWYFNYIVLLKMCIDRLTLANWHDFSLHFIFSTIVNWMIYIQTTIYIKPHCCVIKRAYAWFQLNNKKFYVNNLLNSRPFLNVQPFWLGSLKKTGRDLSLVFSLFFNSFYLFCSQPVN